MSVDLIAAIRAAQAPVELRQVLRTVGIPWMFWQHWLPDAVRTWDGFPPGFFEHYYGMDADRDCPIATAIRRGWQTFTFGEARATFGHTKGARESEDVRNAFGVKDGAIVAGGRAMERSILCVAGPEPMGQWFLANRDVMAVAAVRADALLLDHPGLTEIPRRGIPLSPKQRETLRMHIRHPELPFATQAEKLGISRRMLEKRHAQIAERFGVTSFASAVAIATRESGGV